MIEKRLLVIDDNRDLAELVRRVGVGAGYDVCVATEAVQFMEAFDSFHPTVIVLDMVMPDTDGIQLLQWLVDRRVTARIVVASGFNPLYAKMAAKLGTAKGLVVTYLAKPFRLQELRAVLHQEAA
ncbi:response regulator [Pelagibius sp. Alg239-R121]|uniref:response regulator n=1 Tax=Pelagibius sp. Alg239-R121 TaxID=2993448 RepID=UPI0024A784CF|nr:response regulator [Pelagibius sp. Alg239-R121]